MATNLGTFNIPGNFLYKQGLYDPSTRSTDISGARNYLRTQLPQYDFTDDDLDILIAGGDLPEDISRYDASGKVVVSDQGVTATNKTPQPQDFELDPAVPVDGTSPPADQPGSQGADTDLSPPPPSPPLPSGDDRRVDETVVIDDRGPSQPYFDAQGGGRFYGTGGAFVDPIYGNIQYGTGVVSPTLAGDAAQYNELFPPYLYGNAPSQTLADLDKIGLGLDFIRNLNVSNDEYQQLLTSWWNQVFTPLYQRRVADTQTDVEVSGGGLAPLSDTGRIRGVGASVSPSTLFSGMDQFANTPFLQLESAPDSLYNQLFSGTGDISNALINSLGNLSLEPDQFNISDLDATQQKILADLGTIDVGSGQFDLGDQGATIQKLISDLGKINVGSDQFDLGSP